MGLVQRPINPKVKDVVIGPEKSKRFNKSPWEHKKNERMRWAKDGPRNEAGRRCPKK